jgi:hypothetical protein
MLTLISSKLDAKSTTEEIESMRESLARTLDAVTECGLSKHIPEFVACAERAVELERAIASRKALALALSETFVATMTPYELIACGDRLQEALNYASDSKKYASDFKCCQERKFQIEEMSRSKQELTEASAAFVVATSTFSELRLSAVRMQHALDAAPGAGVTDNALEFVACRKRKANIDEMVAVKEELGHAAAVRDFAVRNVDALRSMSTRIQHALDAAPRAGLSDSTSEVITCRARKTEIEDIAAAKEKLTVEAAILSVQLQQPSSYVSQ